MKSNKSLVITLATIIVVTVAGGSFFTGTKYEQSKNTSDFAGRRADFMGSGAFTQPDGTIGFSGAGQVRGGQMVTGKILSVDENSITVEKFDSGSQTIYFSDTTTISKSTEGTTSDLTVGQEILAIGQSSSDGLVTAENIQIRPEVVAPKE
ncbi:MAG: hypothetical protein UX09_C0063G0005 [Candidatus Uhrbacteria bacterium GW2011_GWE2_45_35]|uniref:DUF5666 domain-containing protein n=2 Tax=Candidatus Uhriibacteriota TaxID=1752732 RepID=A0A0G1J9L0_9BACT|nr:MAG: hypothetical protein UW63_C0080G0005 [Candidatus Uhrbacteria bacterium GW2011_GWF2_44_350]KKU05973.1 MAG: hypothetical protein UX09_C0063G0005 [Candidatus Uhrbacteria bacterium GW2011_GWE2_45_35]HBR81160.1 hypothetical protein [Candidatus Uhrbacteria bacterium]HCU31997.1 hypothetical protein [Candidatus Uhrbacteria bacterium]